MPKPGAGAAGRNRTADLEVTNHLLCQLSYSSTSGPTGRFSLVHGCEHPDTACRKDKQHHSKGKTEDH